MVRYVRPVLALGFVVVVIGALAFGGVLDLSGSGQLANQVVPQPPPLRLPPPPIVYTVTNPADTDDGVCDDDCTLREAINAANHTTALNGKRIEFGFGYAQSLVINVGSPLPEITDAVLIDGANKGIATTVILGGKTMTVNFGPPGNVQLKGSANAGDGLAVSDAGVTIANFSITNFPRNGILLKTAAKATVLGSTISSNTLAGVRVDGSQNTVRNSTITGNGAGVIVNGANNVVRANTITDNAGNGVTLGGTSNTLGGTTADARNVISNNGGNGVGLPDSGINKVIGNYIGTTADGTAASGNKQHGIGVGPLASSANVIGGPTAAERNVISGNTRSGVQVITTFSPSPGTLTIQGNYIGLNAAGTAAIGNGEQGVEVLGETGSAPQSLTPQVKVIGNVLSGNTKAGIFFFGGFNTAQSNLIGTDATGNLTTGLGNHLQGIFIQDGQHNLIGGDTPDLGNVIGNSQLAGVGILSDAAQATSNRIRSNRILKNFGLGIDLMTDADAHQNKVTANDVGDADTGPNNFQNFPVVTDAVSSATQVQLSGSLNSAPNQTYTIDFFASAACDFRHNGPGEQLLGSATLATNAQGSASFNALGFATPTQLTSGVITATATNTATGDSSEFSECRAITVS